MNRDFPPGEWAIPIDLAREQDFGIGPVEVRPSLCLVHFGGREHDIEPRVMQALVALAQRKGSVVSRDELVQRCWNGRIVGDDAINRCIAKVRKLSELGDSFDVETVPRVGYRLVERVFAPEVAVVCPACESAPLDTPARANPAAIRSRGVRAIVAAIACALLLAGVYASFILLRAAQRSAALPVRTSASVVDAGWNIPPGSIFHDCESGCPEMVVIPAGRFVMGSSRGEIASAAHNDPTVEDDESPQHEVLIARQFAMARYDVTRTEYSRFVSETGRHDGASCFTLTHAGAFVDKTGASWRHPGFQQSSADPAVCVSWDDAVAYVAWLAHKTGKPFRLPTEAEWEYAARANADASASESVDGSCKALNGADASYHDRYPGDRSADAGCHDNYPETSPVGSFPANGFGLYDMLGNAAQWVSDCYHKSYDGAPVDGSADLDGGCSLRVARGGHWALGIRNIRVQLREWGYLHGRYSTIGLRVARSL